MKILVTGACGFVGTHFVKRFLDSGWQVTAIDDFSAKTGYPPRWAVEKNLGFSKVDCRDWFKENHSSDFDLVVHCAAIVGGRMTIDGDPLAVATDLAIDADFFNWLAKLKKKPQRVIYFSSSAVYPVDLQTKSRQCLLNEALVNLDASRFGRPDMTYGFAKLAGEYLAQFAAKQYDVPVVIYRPFSGYGPGQSFDYPFPSIVQRVIESFRKTKVSAEKEPVVVWGSGEQLRDFIYIDDVIDAVMETVFKLVPGETLNLGTGIGTSFRQLAIRTGEILDRSIDVINDPTKPEGVFARVCDPHKMLEFYRPRVSLSEGIRRVYEDLTIGSV